MAQSQDPLPPGFFYPQSFFHLLWMPWYLLIWSLVLVYFLVLVIVYIVVFVIQVVGLIFNLIKTQRGKS